MREAILDAAEARMRAAGFNAVSFRDVAADVGVKSASVHYHFPTKEDLGVALVERYSRRVFETLGEPSPERPAESVQAMARLYSDAFVAGKSICLCAMLSAESVGLPPRVTEAVKEFYDASLSWLETVYAGDADAPLRAGGILAALQGGLLISAIEKDGTHMRRAAAAAMALSTTTSLSEGAQA